MKLKLFNLTVQSTAPHVHQDCIDLCPGCLVAWLLVWLHKVCVQPFIVTAIMSIHARLAALQAENASLSEAADEAANLAETLALNNSQLQAQVSGLSETLSRKDRQISRLSSQVHDSEVTINSLNRRIDDLSSQVDELHQVISIADEIEVVLRRTVQTLQKRLESAESQPSAASHQVQTANQSDAKVADTSSNSTLVAAIRTHTDILSLPSESPSISDVHFALANSSAIVALALSALTSHSSHSSNADPLSNSLASATVIGNAAATFLLSDPTLAVQRTKQLSDALILLRDRVSDVAQSRNSKDLPLPPAADNSTGVTCELLQMAVSAMCAILPASIATENHVSKSPFVPDGGLTPEAQASLKQIAQLHTSTTGNNSAEVATKTDPQVSRLKQALTRRERELDDLRVRHTAFEQSVRVAVAEAARASADADALRARLVATESTPAPEIGSPSEGPPESILPCDTEELAGYSLTPEASSFITPVRAFSRLRTSPFPMSGRRSHVNGDVTRTTPRRAQSSGITPMAGSMAQLAQEQLRKLRTTYAISAVESLLSVAPENAHVSSEFETGSIGLKCAAQNDTEDRIYQALRTAQSSGRKAAACARVAQLDKKTLMPVSRGATLSLRQPLEAIACSRRLDPTFSQRTLVGSETQNRTSKDIILSAIVPIDRVDEFARTLGLQAR